MEQMQNKCIIDVVTAMTIITALNSNTNVEITNKKLFMIGRVNYAISKQNYNEYEVTTKTDITKVTTTLNDDELNHFLKNVLRSIENYELKYNKILQAIVVE